MQSRSGLAGVRHENLYGELAGGLAENSITRAQDDARQVSDDAPANEAAAAGGGGLAGLATAMPAAVLDAIHEVGFHSTLCFAAVVC